MPSEKWGEPGPLRPQNSLLDHIRSHQARFNNLVTTAKDQIRGSPQNGRSLPWRRRRPIRLCHVCAPIGVGDVLDRCASNASNHAAVKRVGVFENMTGRAAFTPLAADVLPGEIGGASDLMVTDMSIPPCLRFFPGLALSLSSDNSLGASVQSPGESWVRPGASQQRRRRLFAPKAPVAPLPRRRRFQ